MLAPGASIFGADDFGLFQGVPAGCKKKLLTRVTRCFDVKVCLTFCDTPDDQFRGACPAPASLGRVKGPSESRAFRIARIHMICFIFY
jgi:hypothetical protein